MKGVKKKMEKIEEAHIWKNYIKTYSYEGARVMDIIDLLQNNSINIESIEIRENVEADMQTVSGDSYNNVNDFFNNFNSICLNGSELSFDIEATYNNEPITVSVNEKNQIVHLTTKNPELELNELLATKSL